VLIIVNAKTSRTCPCCEQKNKKKNGRTEEWLAVALSVCALIAAISLIGAQYSADHAGDDAKGTTILVALFLAMDDFVFCIWAWKDKAAEEEAEST
jgi:hypothetical protein